MIWIILIFLIFAGSTGAVVYRISSQVGERKSVLMNNLTVVKEEIVQKRKLLEELAKLSLSYESASIIEKVKAEIAVEEENQRAEKGKLTIAQAELEAVDLRLRELEEIERELETSSLEAAKEVEMLRSREREIQARNVRLREQLENSLIQFERLLHELATSQDAVNKLTAAKGDLIETQKKIEYYDQEISTINHKYMGLKRAYDALDIEYAQLYEKHSQG